MGQKTRVGKLGRVFGGGRSELLNAIARLTIFYEDLRLEMNEFKSLYNAVITEGQEGLVYRLAYFLRRALATLVEFRSALTTLRALREYKDAQENTLSAEDAATIREADRFLSVNWQRINGLRNEFGGHITIEAVRFATENLGERVGSVNQSRDSDGWTLGLECPFAADLIAGVISSKVQGADVVAEYRAAVQMLNDGFLHAQRATATLVGVFLWPRFGL